MKYLKKSSILCLLMMFIGIKAINIHAQETVTSSGGNASGGGGSVSYTVGQVAYTSNKSSTGTVSQGVQQPYEILVVTGLEEANGINLEFSVYPNPTTDFLKLKVENYILENLIYQLYDANGSLIQNGKIMGKETVIKTGDLTPAAYYLRISDNEKEIKTFKIIKN
jgi:hypothetical protein